jgi:hypothetical protein
VPLIGIPHLIDHFGLGGASGGDGSFSPQDCRDTRRRNISRPTRGVAPERTTK